MPDVSTDSITPIMSLSNPTRLSLLLVRKKLQLEPKKWLGFWLGFWLGLCLHREQLHLLSNLLMDLDKTEIVVSENVKLLGPEDMFAMLNKLCIRNLFGQDITHVPGSQ